LTPVTQTLTLNSTVLNIARPNWLFARTCRLRNKTGLLVYRSVLMRESDPMFDGVREFIASNQFEVAWKGRYLDGKMMFNEGELTIYLTPAEGRTTEIPEDLADELRNEGLRFLERLEAVG
jgi:hypothetical protein